MIKIKTKQEIGLMAEGGKKLALIMEKLKKQVRPGITTKELNRAAEALVFDFGAESAFLNHEGFPAVLCCCVNNVIVHGVPSEYVLKAGDIISLDLGLKYKGFYTDTALTEIVDRGQTPNIFEKMRLVRVAKKALKFGIAKAKPGNTFGDIGNTIQRFVESQGFSVAKDLCGHGIGRDLHEDPQIPNESPRHKREQIKEGMVFCIEPMVCMGKGDIKKSADGFGYETKDGLPVAHFEHTLAIVNGKPKILTKL